MAVADRLLARRFAVDRLERQGDLDELLAAAHRVCALGAAARYGSPVAHCRVWCAAGVPAFAMGLLKRLACVMGARVAFPIACVAWRREPPPSRTCGSAPRARERRTMLARVKLTPSRQVGGDIDLILTKELKDSTC